MQESMSDNRLKKIARGFIPPFIYSGLARIKVYKKKKAQSGWLTVKNGLLQGRQLFLSTVKGGWQESMVEGSYDQFIFEYLQKVDIKGAVIFDVGSHIGFHALNFASLVGDKGSVYAFEPNRFNRERMSIILERNPDLAKRIRMFEVALSDKSGYEDFYFCKDVDGGASSGSFIAKAHTYYPKSQQYLELFEKSPVETVALDDIASYIGTDIVPYVMKIDVEGAESSVLQGGVELLKKHRPLIIMEVHSIYNMLKTYDILQSAHYKIVLLKEELDGRCFIAAESHTEALP
jgi:FkbM family methyltransferase